MAPKLIRYEHLAHNREVDRFESDRGHHADVVKSVDTPDLGSGAERRVGSSPTIRTNFERLFRPFVILWLEQQSGGQPLKIGQLSSFTLV